MYGSDTCRDMAPCAAMLDRRSPSPRFDYFFSRLPFRHPLFLLLHEYIKVHAFLSNITCVHEQTDLSLSLLQLLLISTAHQVALYAGNGNPPDFSSQFFLFFFFSLIFIHSFILLISIYSIYCAYARARVCVCVCVYIFLYFKET